MTHISVKLLCEYNKTMPTFVFDKAFMYVLHFRQFNVETAHSRGIIHATLSLNLTDDMFIVELNITLGAYVSEMNLMYSRVMAWFCLIQRHNFGNVVIALLVIAQNSYGDSHSNINYRNRNENELTL